MFKSYVRFALPIVISCIAILEAGMLQKDVARIMVSQKITDFKLLIRRYLGTGSVASKGHY